MTTRRLMTDTSKAWACRLVAMWCDKRAHEASEALLVRRCRTAYKGPLAAPVNRFADLLETQSAANAAQWRALGEELKAEAEREVLALQRKARRGQWEQTYTISTKAEHTL